MPQVEASSPFEFLEIVSGIVRQNTTLVKGLTGPQGIVLTNRMRPSVAEQEGQTLRVAFLHFRSQAIVPRHGLPVIVGNKRGKVRVWHPVEVVVRAGGRRYVVDKLCP